MLDEPIHLEPHRPEWLTAFEAERDRIAEALGVASTVVQHIGSTAVVGLDAKPIIDIMIGSSRVPPPEPWTAGLAKLGYQPMGEAGVPGRWYFRLRVPPCRNVHLVQLDGSHWIGNLALRNYLQVSPDACRRYCEVKRTVVAGGATSLIEYSRAKRAIVETLLGEALSTTHSTNQSAG
jgi:GrpB-like predicted nucleotidyltransferase (UPF0157 family)